MFRFIRKHKKPAVVAGREPRLVATSIETLEPRRLLSTTALSYDSVIMTHNATTNSSIQGYTPSEIRAAYGFDSVAFSGSTVSANGQGQTIAIIDAYNDPNIVSDLAVFDAAFGLSAPASFKVVNQTGGSKLPSTDSGWSGEISLDVEWAHAIAPGANILLVEANSSDTTDLMAAVDYARHASGVSVVSMSWGGSEFFSWGGGGESESQTTYDPIFTTPAGHRGVTFIASAGDSGSQSGVQWPASSTNVLSVGGTSLYTSSTGVYQSESSWNGTSSGYSQIESEPTYQAAVQSTGVRSVADVSYAGDPNTGFAVYDSLPDSGYSGWQEVGGTSAGAPQWAALIAIVDQGRVISGETSLDGATQTLPMLYNLYSAAGTSGYSSYTSYFNDVVDSVSGYGGGDPWHWRWGGYGNSDSIATTGYDTVTGLGSPKAASLVTALIGVSASSTTPIGSTGSTTSTGSGSSGTTTVAALPASPLSAVFSDAPIASVLEGANGSLELLLTNNLSTKFSGPVTVTLYASTDNSLSSDDTVVAKFGYTTINIRSGHSKTLKLKYSYPTSLSDGTYDVIGSVSALGTGTAAAEADALAPVTISSPTVDLATSFSSTSGVTVNPGHSDSTTVTIQNLGNVTASGTLSLLLYASSLPTLDSGAVLLASLAGRVIHIRAGHSVTLRIHFTAPLSAAAGSYYLVASSSSTTLPGDANSSNNSASVPTIS